MIIFYKQQDAYKNKVLDICSSDCSVNCIKPKNKCCFKYKKKGVNCKRCPKLFEQTILKEVS